MLFSTVTVFAITISVELQDIFLTLHEETLYLLSSRSHSSLTLAPENH